ncbi:MAG: glutamate racemase, partial [Desulfobacterales bacterium]|nr:glutamate racemase [Desulfobacterales bacterium]
KNSVAIIDPGDAVAIQTKRVLIEFDLISNNSNDPKFHFYTTGKKIIVEKFLSRQMDRPYGLEQIDV